MSDILIRPQCVNTLRPRQNGRRFADDTFKHIFLNESVIILIKISLKFVPKGPINNIPALVQIMAWLQSGDKPLSEPMMVSLPTHICVTRPQWVKSFSTMQETQMWMMIISSEEPYKTYKIQHIPMLTVPRWNNENEVGIPTVEVRQPSPLPPIKKKNPYSDKSVYWNDPTSIHVLQEPKTTNFCDWKPSAW